MRRKRFFHLYSKIEFISETKTAMLTIIKLYSFTIMHFMFIINFPYIENLQIVRFVSFV